MARSPLFLARHWSDEYARRRRSSIESIVSRRDSTHLVLSKDSSAGVRPSVGSRDRGYNLLPLMDGASLRTMRDHIAVGIALLKFNPPDGELISTRSGIIYTIGERSGNEILLLTRSDIVLSGIKGRFKWFDPEDESFA